jgi:hypothetical protein
LIVVSGPVGGIGQDGIHIAQFFTLALSRGLGGLILCQQTGQSGRDRGQIKHAVPGDQHRRRAAVRTWLPDAPDKATPQALHW